MKKDNKINKNQNRNYLYNIFSATNSKDGKYKIITLFGLKIKFKRDGDYKTVQKNYKKVIKRIKNKDKICVLFLSQENQKWTYQSLYDAMEKDESFEPIIVVSPLNILHKTKSKNRTSVEENYNFFKSRGMNVFYGYENGEYINLKEFKPDIVFYDEQWFPSMHKPLNVSKYALTMYAPYGYQTFNYESNYVQSFHKLLHTYFVENDYNVKRFESYKRGNNKNCKVLGYLRFDEFLKNNEINEEKIWKNPDKYKIIYAPHHSFGQKETKANIGTFMENYKFILNLAKSHPETTWIFKPHPRLRYNILEANHLLSEEELEQYYEEWTKIGRIEDSGDYFDIFKTSDLMITDSASFLTEYLPTTKPLIRLSRKDAIQSNKFGKKIMSGYYFTYNNKELEQVFEQIVVKKDDSKKEIREKLSKLVIDNEPAADKILNYIKTVIQKEQK